VKIVWTAEARQSLRSIQRFIALDSELYAGRMVARIIESVEAAADMPGRVPAPLEKVTLK
jgi:plasmid stabilization system protein ParE